MLISIIIPVYNTEKLLSKCLESVQNQTYKDLEIILVNDGSTDQSGFICDEYSKKDNRFKVIHKENGGVSSARNTALNIARGQYVGFIDSDDWVEPQMFENLYKIIKEYHADISICNYFKDSENKSEINSSLESGIISYNQQQAFNTILDSNSFKGYLCNKLFSMEIIKQNHITFDEKIHFCEDLLFCCQYLLKSKSVVYDTSPYYHYIIHGSNVTQSQFSAKKLTSLKGLVEIIELLREVEGIKLNKYKNYYMHMNISLLMNGIKENKCTKECLDELKKNLFRYPLNTLNDKSVKLSCVIGRISVTSLFLIWKISGKG